MKTIVLHSGGMDSTVLLYRLKMVEGHEVKAFSVDYGQRHKRELNAAKVICTMMGIESYCADLSSLRHVMAGSSLTDNVTVPAGRYDDEIMKQTVVPNRNMILLACATAWAVSQKYDAVAYAAHAGDHTIYPDCRPEFMDRMRSAMDVCDWHSVKLLTPFADLSKADLVQIGMGLRVPFGFTWSCYEGGQVHCGECGTCVERREAFAIAGVKDPVAYGNE